jgi:hypothetical protein
MILEHPDLWDDEALTEITILRTSRLVATIVVRGHKRVKASAKFATASMTCSQLSSTSRRCLPPAARATDSAEISPASFSPSVLATVDGTRPGSDSEASSTIHPPSSKSESR